MVDDGFHTMKSIGLTFESFRPFLHESFLYVVEDIALDDLESSKELFKDYHIDVCDADERILAITPRAPLIDPQACTELKLDPSILKKCLKLSRIQMLPARFLKPAFFGAKEYEWKNQDTIKCCRQSMLRDLLQAS